MIRVYMLGLVATSLIATLVWTEPAQAPDYHIVARYPIGGDGGWDYVTIDTARHRVFIGRENRVMVVDEATGKLLSEIGGALKRVHGVALSYPTGHGFITSGGDSTVTMFDLATLEVLGTTTAADDADAILYDGPTGHVFTMNGDAHSSSVIDARTGKRIGTIPLGGKPEFGVSDGAGKLYANIADKNEVVEIDAKAQTVLRRWPVSPCDSPTGLAIDAARHHLFSGCRNKLMAISDASAGKLLTTIPIGGGVDANAYDAVTRLAFSSNGDGTLTVVREEPLGTFVVAQTVQTAASARTMALDPATHRIYTVAAKLGTPAPGQRRPPVVPGTFEMLVLSR
jgi:YVTN family beta-propeller protein